MNVGRGNSVTKLQRDINRELTNMKLRREFSMGSLKMDKSLRENFSKSVKSVFIEDEVKGKKIKRVGEKKSLEKTAIKGQKVGRSQEAERFKNIKSTAGKLKKKKLQSMSTQFTAKSRKLQQPQTQANSILSTFTSIISQAQYNKLLQENKKNLNKIQSQKHLIQRLQSIIEQLLN